jgi:hypothetical protein
MNTVAIVIAIAAALVLVIIAIIAVPRLLKSRHSDKFWTQYGGAIPADEQVRRFDAAEKGVPDMAWAEAYWPPNYCRAIPPPVPGEPKRPPF